MNSAERMPAIPALADPADPVARQEFARRLGEIAAAISNESWEGVEPRLAALWDEAKSAVPWHEVREIALRGWLAMRRFY